MRKSPVTEQIQKSGLRLILRYIFSLPLLAIILVSCNQPDVINDLSNQSFHLLDQDSTRVIFPDYYEDQVTVLGFIYTNCPDVCSAITANMSNISQELENPEDVHFVGITFDPRRDKPSVLKDYMQQFKLNDDQFTFVTGDTATVDSLLNSLNIVAEVSHTKTNDEGEEFYLMNHTNRISLLDKQGRVRLEYSGSFSKPDQIIEGINRLR